MTTRRRQTRPADRKQGRSATFSWHLQLQLQMLVVGPVLHLLARWQQHHYDQHYQLACSAWRIETDLLTSVFDWLLIGQMHL